MQFESLDSFVEIIVWFLYSFFFMCNLDGVGVV